MSKILLDKYYTPRELAKYCVEKTNEIIGVDNISEYIEPSAGSGVFLEFFDKPFLAYDIEPDGDNIQKADWLEADLEYKKGRCIIGNPPFGTRNTLAVKFYKKSIEICDYTSFILPISQYNNNQQMYEFDLIYSEDLGVVKYSDIKVHCCFNIYKRPKYELNGKVNYKLKDIQIKEFRSKKLSLEDEGEYDLRICFWGSATGKICEYKGQYAHEMGIVVNNQKYKENIISLFINTQWNEVYSFTSTPALYQWQIYKYIKEQIPELE